MPLESPAVADDNEAIDEETKAAAVEAGFLVEEGASTMCLRTRGRIKFSYKRDAPCVRFNLRNGWVG